MLIQLLLLTSMLRADCPFIAPTITPQIAPTIAPRPGRELFDKKIPVAMNILVNTLGGDNLHLGVDGRDKDYKNLVDKYGDEIFKLAGHIESGVFSINLYGWDEDDDDRHDPIRLLYSYNRITGKQISYFKRDKYWIDIIFNNAFPEERRYTIEDGQIWESNSVFAQRRLKITSCGYRKSPQDAMDSYFVKMFPYDGEFLKDESNDLHYNKILKRYYINGVFLVSGWHLDNIEFHNP